MATPPPKSQIRKILFGKYILLTFEKNFDCLILNAGYGFQDILVSLSKKHFVRSKIQNRRSYVDLKNNENYFFNTKNHRRRKFRNFKKYFLKDFLKIHVEKNV